MRLREQQTLASIASGGIDKDEKEEDDAELNEIDALIE